MRRRPPRRPERNACDGSLSLPDTRDLTINTLTDSGALTTAKRTTANTTLSITDNVAIIQIPRRGHRRPR